MRWRKWNNAVHRDIGYLCIGLTLMYALSGIAVNHTSPKFNPSYDIEKHSGNVTPLVQGRQPDMVYVHQILTELNESGTFKNVALLSPEDLRVFVEGTTIDVNIVTGVVTMEKITRKPVLYEVNSLHLNKNKKAWTWVADVYAIALALLAVTGLLMIRGKGKIRSLLLVFLGFAVPLGFLIFFL